MAIDAKTGQIIGRDHMLRQANRQDGVALRTVGPYTVGIITDGCGEGHASEVGATLGAQYLIQQASDLLAMGAAPAEVTETLYNRMIHFLDYLVLGMQPADRTTFVQHHLLFTIVGVIASETDGVIFTAGDGLFVIDDTLTKINQDNTPGYIAYHLLDSETLGGYKPQHGFDAQPLPADWSRVAIASDGFEPELLDQVWALSHPRALQRKLNGWSNTDHRFRDDATIITLERTPDHD